MLRLWPWRGGAHQSAAETQHPVHTYTNVLYIVHVFVFCTVYTSARHSAYVRFDVVFLSLEVCFSRQLFEVFALLGKVVVLDAIRGALGVGISCDRHVTIM